MSWLPSPEYADWWYEFSWKGIIGFGAAAVLATAATVIFTVVQFWSDGIRDEQAEARNKAMEVQLATANDSAAKANEAAGRANERAAKAELELEKYRAPRVLTPDQYQKLVSGLREAPKGRVVVKPNFADMEANSFAGQIVQAFTDAGFDGVGDAPLDIISVSRPGLLLVIRDKESPPPAAQLILRAFGEAGVSISGHREDWAPADAVVIMVSTKP